MADYEKPPLSDADFLRELAGFLNGKADGMDTVRRHVATCELGSDEWNEWVGVYKGIRSEAEYLLRLAHPDIKKRCGF